MKFFKNTEIAELYNVSEKTVRNWIEAAQNNKLGLELHDDKNKSYIADTLNNHHVIKKLVNRGRKYRNTRGFKSVDPTSEFYSLYSPEQIKNIINSIDTYHEIPQGYTYFGMGADYWDSYTNRLANENEENTLTSNIELVHFNMEPIKKLTMSYDKINVIDIGVGNALPAKELLCELQKTGKLDKYIGIDISQDMINIAKRNVRNWFGNKIKFGECIKDIAYDRFGEIISDNTFSKDNSSTINLFLFFGTTITNFSDTNVVLTNIRNSMGKNDLLLTFLKLDSPKARRFFDFNVKSDKAMLDMQEKFILDLMNIDQSFYDIEQFYDERKHSRIIQVRFKVTLSVNFKMGGLKRSIEINKGETIVLWRAIHFSDYEIIGKYNDNKFSLMQATKSRNEEYLLLITKIETKEL